MNEKIKAYIDSIEDEDQRLKLYRFQWRLDAELNKIKDPIARYNRMVELLFKQLEEFYIVLSDPSSLKKKESPPDNIIPIRKD